MRDGGGGKCPHFFVKETRANPPFVVHRSVWTTSSIVSLAALEFWRLPAILHSPSLARAPSSTLQRNSIVTGGG